ncbi:MAG: hypothetical protein H7202_11275 [Pedobacter sp.]|nr:hypothetical protein [Pedobacter sp.]
MAKTPKNIVLDGDRDKYKQTELQKVKEYLFNNIATMKQVFINTTVLRENICRRIADLRKAGQVCKIKIGRCPITGHRNVGFYTSNPTLFVVTPQLDLFGEGGSNA